MPYTENEERILDWCASLAQSQGFYERLLSALKGDRELLHDYAEQGFNDILDFVMFVEC